VVAKNSSSSARALTSIFLKVTVLWHGFFTLLYVSSTLSQILGLYSVGKGNALSMGPVVSQALSSVLGPAFLVLVYLKASAIARWVFPDDVEIPLSGDPFLWALPALQIVGLFLLVDAAAAVMPAVGGLWSYLQSGQAAALDRLFWNSAWAIFVKTLVGFLLFKDPRWLVDRMRRNAIESL
jgi:hypothetical protein